MQSSFHTMGTKHYSVNRLHNSTENARVIRSIALLHLLSTISRFANATPPSSFISSSPHPSKSRLSSSKARSNSMFPIIELPSTRIDNKIEQFTKSNVLVQIERTAQNERRISGELVLNHDHHNLDIGMKPDRGEHTVIGIFDLWDILTDYDNLSTHVPNLVESRIIRHADHRRQVKHNAETTSKIGPRIYQKGAQRIWGFEFGADVTMDMKEHVIDYSAHHATIKRKCILDFKCVSSQFFSQFDGSWIVEEQVVPSLYGTTATTTSVKYIVDVRPKGLVPVAALEWRIKEDVPTNMLGVVNAAVGRRSTSASRIFRKINDKNSADIDWYRDETLSMYL